MEKTGSTECSINMGGNYTLSGDTAQSQCCQGTKIRTKPLVCWHRKQHGVGDKAPEGQQPEFRTNMARVCVHRKLISYLTGAKYTQDPSTTIHEPKGQWLERTDGMWIRGKN